MHAEHGCQDIDECQASGGKVCETNQFCMNLGQDHLFTSLACYHGSMIATFWGGFFNFLVAKDFLNFFLNILATALKSYIMTLL